MRDPAHARHASLFVVWRVCTRSCTNGKCCIFWHGIFDAVICFGFGLGFTAGRSRLVSPPRQVAFSLA